MSGKPPVEKKIGVVAFLLRADISERILTLMSSAANTNSGETETTTVMGKLVRIMNLTDRFGNVEIGHGATILAGDSLVIEGFDSGYAKGGRSYDRSFAIGDVARYGGMNLDYTGVITSITAKTVTIKDEKIVKRLSIAEFARKNRFFSVAESTARNAAWLD